VHCSRRRYTSSDQAETRKQSGLEADTTNELTEIDMVQQGRQRGFTLQELLIAVAVFFIVTAIGVPSYINFVRNGARDNSTTQLFSDLYYARSEAVKRKVTVSLCRSGDVSVTNPGCGGSANDWSKGWIVFVDENGNGSFDSGTDKLLKIGETARTGIQVMGNSKVASSLVFNTDGSLATGYAPAKFAVCDNRGTNNTYDTASGKYIDIGAMGRPEISFIRNNATQTCTP